MSTVLEDWIYLYYLNESFCRPHICMFLRIEFICIIWTLRRLKQLIARFLRIEFICIIWTKAIRCIPLCKFLRIEFICIIWTCFTWTPPSICSWGLNLFVLFEQVNAQKNLAKSSWGLNLFVLFELVKEAIDELKVLEDWIYLYYLNQKHLWHWPFPVLEDWIYLYYLNKNVSNRKY